MPKFLRHMNRPPAFQWYGKDWLTSKKRAVMDLEQQGAYVNLLSHCWDTDDCSLPNDDTMLAALSELRDRWSDRAAPLKACFVEHPKRPGHITNLRLLEEFTKLLNYRREKQAAGHVGGVKSGQSRRNVKGNHSEADLKLTLDSASSKAEAKRTSSSSSSSSSASSIKNNKSSITPQDDVGWIAGLKTNPAYQHIALDLELGKMREWLNLPKNKHRKLTRQFVLNWLNKIEVPMITPPQKRILYT